MPTKMNPGIGDTAFLGLTFVPSYTGLAHIRLDFPGYIVPFGASVGSKFSDTLVQVDSGVIYHDSIPFNLTACGSSIVEFALLVDSSIALSHNVGRFTNDYVDVEHSASVFTVSYSTTRLDKIDTLILDNRTQGVSTLNISGKVTYADLDQHREQGAFGANVILVFVKRNADGSSSNGSWAHPALRRY